MKKEVKLLKFGTSGLRDKDERLTDFQVYITTKGFINYLASIGLVNLNKKEKVALAGDFRPSTNRIMVAVAATLLEMGFDIDYCGRVPTPQVSYWGFSNNIPSIMVTGSHIPYGENGVKYNRNDRELLKTEEKPMLEQVRKIADEEFNKTSDESFFNEDESFKGFDNMSNNQKLVYLSAKYAVKEENKNIMCEIFYFERYKNIFGDVLKGENITFYEQTSVGREIVPKILKSLGADVKRVGRIDERKEFIQIDTENMKQEIIEDMARLARINKSEICVTVDGDGDRPAMVIIDENDNHSFIEGDKLNVMSALLLKPKFVAAPVTMNNKAVQVFEKEGVEVKLTKVGSPYVVKSMIDKNKQGEYKMYGFENNGGTILGSDLEFNGKIIKKLPTRDAVIPIICTIVHAKQKNKKVSELHDEIFSGEYKSHIHKGLVDNVISGCENYTAETGQKIIRNLTPEIDELNVVQFNNETLTAISHSGDKIELDREKENKIKEIINEILIILKDINGLENVKVKKLNFLDGVRIYLTNEEIVHLRPSNNSPQLRFFAEAATRERVEEMVENSVRANTGMLVNLIKKHVNC